MEVNHNDKGGADISIFWDDLKFSARRKISRQRFFNKSWKHFWQANPMEIVSIKRRVQNGSV